MGVLGYFNPDARKGLESLLWAIGECLRSELLKEVRQLKIIQRNSPLFRDIVRFTGIKMYGQSTYDKRSRNVFGEGLQRYIMDNADCKFISIRTLTHLPVLMKYFLAALFEDAEQAEEPDERLGDTFDALFNSSRVGE